MILRKWSWFLLVLSAVQTRAAEPLKTPVGEIQGSLVIAGGGNLPDAIRDRFIELAGGKQAKIVVIPTASASADGADADKALEPWRKKEVASVVLFHTRKKAEANDPNFLKALTEATGVWLGAATSRSWSRRIAARLWRRSCTACSSAAASLAAPRPAPPS